MLTRMAIAEAASVGFLFCKLPEGLQHSLEQKASETPILGSV